MGICGSMCKRDQTVKSRRSNLKDRRPGSPDPPKGSPWSVDLIFSLDSLLLRSARAPSCVCGVTVRSLFGGDNAGGSSGQSHVHRSRPRTAPPSALETAQLIRHASEYALAQRGRSGNTQWALRQCLLYYLCELATVNSPCYKLICVTRGLVLCHAWGAGTSGEGPAISLPATFSTHFRLVVWRTDCRSTDV